LNQSEPNLILTAHATKLNRPEPNWTEPQTCLAGRNHALNLIQALTLTLLRAYTKQHAVVSIQLNIVARPTYPEKFIRDIVIALFLLLSVAIVTLPGYSRTFSITRLLLCWDMLFYFLFTFI